MLEISNDGATLGIRQTNRAADGRAAKAKVPGIAQSPQVQAKVVDPGAKTVEATDLDLRTAQQ